MVQTKKRKILKYISLAVVILLAVTAVLNRVVVADFVRGIFYQPSAEEIAIRENLKLTNKGLRIFNASYPSLNSKDDFNENCVSYDESVYVLGCYTGKQIYVYNIANSDLEGIRELTMAHELLHAVYERMPSDEKNRINQLLEGVYNDNKELLGAELSSYSDADKYDELHARIGTEIADLPGELEKHYAEIFRDRDLVAAYYDSYITPFRELEAKREKLKAELETLEGEIMSKTSEYETRVEAHNAEVKEFNICADMPGCFKSNYEFQRRRRVLVSENEELVVLRAEVGDLTNYYNEKVEEYNQNVLKNQELQNLVNSNANIDEIK